MIPLREAAIVFAQAMVAVLFAGAAGLAFIGARQARWLWFGLCVCGALVAMSAVRGLVR